MFCLEKDILKNLCGFKFNISAKPFYQVNPQQTEVLYNKAIEYANLTGKEVVLDAYCGIGTIGLISSKKAKNVIGVEVNKEAIKDAIHNARNNNIKNTKFYCADASLFMIDLAESKQNIDVVFFDPPRAGCDETFLKSLVILNPRKIVYVSCDPKTLARDLFYLVNNKYKVLNIQPVDMFPQRTYHPIKNYFSTLKWDGVKRLDTLLIDYLGADDSKYVRAVTRKTLCAAVARVYEPGRKYDSILVLNGPQGIGKSTFFAILGKEWYSDSLSIADMKDKTAAEKLQGYWILELYLWVLV